MSVKITLSVEFLKEHTSTTSIQQEKETEQERLLRLLDDAHNRLRRLEDQKKVKALK